MHAALQLALAAAAKDPPIIDLDLTVILQLIVFLTTAVLLSRLLFRPFLEVRNAREAGIEGARDDARRMDEEARARIADYDARLGRAKVKANDDRLALRGEAMVREREIGEKARGETQVLLDAARGKLERDAAEARHALEPRTREIAGAMARKILGREVA